MPKYLITATAFKRAEDGREAYTPRTFSFEAVLDAPWSAKNSQPVNDLAFHECHRAFGWWPKHGPQIESVVEISGGLPEDLRSRLFAAALMNSDEIADLLTDLMNWDEGEQSAQHRAAAIVANQMPGRSGNTETLPPEADDYDELI